MVIKNLIQKSRFIPSWQKTIAFAFVIGSLAVSRMASGQLVAPVGARVSSPIVPLAPCVACSELSIESHYQRESFLGLGRSRTADAVVGFVVGGLIGFGIGAAKAHHDLSHCGEACEGPFAGVNQMLGGIVIGGALGAVVGAFWPVRE